MRDAGRPLVAMSAAVHEKHLALKKFLNRHLYRHENKLAMTDRVQAVISELFAAYMRDISLMSDDFSKRAARA